MKKLKHNNTSVVNINYHIIWCPKYRRNVLVDGVETRLKELLPIIANENGCCVETMEVMPDHIHIFIKGNPTIPIHLIVKNLKGTTSRIPRSEFPHLRKRLPCLWTRSYYCKTIGCINEETIKKYIENQKFN
ncbi:MAG: IS200/IS605 family transposase [Alphaproteobacteria bacterium]|nr:IS200/IS605 family transposase [Alphaproteobacteria bacterium]